MTSECQVQGCERRALARNMCSMHYQRWKRGSLEPEFDIETAYPIGLSEQFERNTVREGECLIWTGKINSNGYGRISLSKKKRGLAHRIAYEVNCGSIPEGAVVDHRCHNRAAHEGLCPGGIECRHRRCVEPSHLEAVTQSENLLRSPHRARKVAR